MEIYVLLNKLDEAADECRSLANRLSQIDSRFNSLSRSLDWKLRSKSNIIKYINTLSSQLNKAEDTMKKHSSFLMNAKSTYMNADGSEKAASEALKNKLYKNGRDNNVNNGVSKDNNKHTKNETKSEVDKFIEKLSEKGILAILKEYSKYTIGLNFIFGISNIFVKIKNYYDKYITGIKSIPAFLLDTISTGIGSLSTWVSTAFNFDSLLKAGNGVDALKNTGLQRICKYVPVINVPIKFAQTYAESYNEYTADGDFSRTDLASTLIDSSVNGLFAVGSGLFTIYTGPTVWIKGALLGGQVAFDSANSGFGLDKKASAAIKDWANSAGQKLKNSNGEITPETAIYSGLYGIGWTANKALDVGECAAKGIQVGAENISSAIKNFF